MYVLASICEHTHASPPQSQRVVYWAKCELHMPINCWVNPFGSVSSVSSVGSVAGLETSSDEVAVFATFMSALRTIANKVIIIMFMLVCFDKTALISCVFYDQQTNTHTHSLTSINYCRVRVLFVVVVSPTNDTSAIPQCHSGFMLPMLRRSCRLSGDGGGDVDVHGDALLFAIAIAERAAALATQMI